MAHNEELARRIRDEIGAHPALVEKKMFGGIAFMIDGNFIVSPDAAEATSNDLDTDISKAAFGRSFNHPSTVPR